MKTIFLNPGEESRLYCNNCKTEFDITLEPKAADFPDQYSKQSKTPVCPFCGEGEELEES